MHRFLFACSLFFLASFAATAQPTTGAISGTVADANTRQFLNRAEVRLQGTDLVTLTDNEGVFRFSDVPPGRQILRVEYLGLDPAQFPVTVEAGRTATATFELKSEVYVMGEFVVASQREGQAAALNLQRNADSMKSVVASDAFGDLHDNNAAELLKSIPGLALDYSGEDAIGFTMRGQDSLYASVAVDGNPVASGANNGPAGRQVNFRNITVNNIESVEINRAPTAAEPANSLGGSVNFVSKSAFSQRGRRLRVDVGMNVNTDSLSLSRSYEGFDKEAYTFFPAFQVNFSDTLRATSEHPIGVVANALLGGRYLHNSNFNRTYTYVPAVPAGQMVSENTPAIANSVVMREASAGWRQRSLGANIDYKLSPRTTLFARVAYQEGPQFTVYAINHGITFTAANQTSGSGAAMVAVNGNSADRMDSRPNATPVAAGSSTGSRITKTSGTQGYNGHWHQLSGGSRHRLGSLSIDTMAYYGRAQDQRPPSWETKLGTLTYDVTNVGFIVENVQNPDSISVRQTSGADYRDLSSYGRMNYVQDTRNSLDRRWGARIDARWQVPRAPFPILVQGGVTDDTQCRITTGSSTGARGWFGTGPDGTFGNADDVPLGLGQFVDVRLPGGWIHEGPVSSGVDTGSWLDAARLWAYVDAHPTAFTRDLVLDAQMRKNKKVFIEDIPAAYVMATARFGKLSVVPGVRWEQTRDEGKSWVRATAPISASLPLAERAALTEAQYRYVVRRTTYDDFYPNLQAKYAVSANFIVRAAFTETIGRPNFGTLLPNDAINVTNGTISRNNPALQPFNARNYDISAEYYFGRSTGSVTASVFRKDISNYFTNVSFFLPGGADNGYDGLYEGYTVTEQRNIPGITRTEGFELGYQQSLRFLPWEFRNLILTGAYTHLKSTPPPGVLRVTGIYPDVLFAGVAYVGHGLRVDLKYNLRKKWYTAVNNANGELTYNDDDGRWDFAVNYRFARRYELYFNWRNLTGSVADTYIGGRRINYQKSGSLINVGVRTDF